MFYPAVTVVVFLIIWVLIWSISGLFLYINASLTVRAYRKILLHMTYPTAITSGIIVCIAIHNHHYLLQNDVLALGALLLFLLSFISISIRRHTYTFAGLWSYACLIWAIVEPVKWDGLL